MDFSMTEFQKKITEIEEKIYPKDSLILGH